MMKDVEAKKMQQTYKKLQEDTKEGKKGARQESTKAPKANNEESKKA